MLWINEVKIAISGLNNTDNPAPGIPVAKSLTNTAELIGLSYDPNEPGNYQGLFKKIYIMPYPSNGYNEFISRIQYIKNQDNIHAIIPNLDAELPLYIKYQNQINKMGIKLCLPSQESFNLRNKNKLGELSNKLDIEYPKTYEISSIAELQKITNENEFPLMIKGNYYKAYRVHNLNQAINAFVEISNEWGLPILVQKYVIGEEINLVGVADGLGELKGAVAIKKLTTTSIGKIWLGLTIKNDRLMQIAKDFIKLTSWKGPFELECIIDNDSIYMIEINPRLPSWVYFATEIGINLPQMVIDVMDNKNIQPYLEYPQNKMYIRFVDELVTDFDNYKTLFLQKEISR